ncbi:MFS transporter, partial [Oceanospirillum sp. HFRX-1_2]
GELATFKKGIERIIGESPVPVVPMALEGLWGSFFSHKDGRALTKRPKRFWSKVTLKVAPAVEASEVSAASLQEKVQALLQE